MKKFVVPTMEVVYFGRKVIVTASTPCWCDSCTVCPDGKNDCSCYDFAGYYNPTNE